MPAVDYISREPKSPPTPEAPRRLSVLGSTGSIGVQTLDVAARNPDLFPIVGLAAGGNATLLAEQAARFRPAHLSVAEEKTARDLRVLLPNDYRPTIHVGAEGIATLATLPEADMIVAAVSGGAGLKPTAAAARAGKRIALANKESLVMAGDLLRLIAKQTGAVILPVDSEHNALFQALAGRKGAGVKRLVLTASGGPFFGRDAASLASVTPAQALAHPTWKMGPRISVDSATLANKGLEVIEACRLFGLPPDRVEVLVHPQSIVHSLVEYEDGSMIAELGAADMRRPIGWCLAHPGSLPNPGRRLSLTEMGGLFFHHPDFAAFPCLELAYRSLDPDLERAGPIAFNAADEVAVDAFLNERIGFLDIPVLVAQALELARAAQAAGDVDVLDLESILDFDARVRAETGRMIARGLS